MRNSLNGLWRMLCVGALGLLAACGDVNEEPVGSGGAGSDGAGSGSTGSLDARQACMNFCNAHNASGCEPPESDCDDFCDDQIEHAGAACENRAAVLFVCALLHVSTCSRDAPPSCEAEVVALDKCMDTLGCSGRPLCSGGGGEEGQTCSCEAMCVGMRHETRCETPAGGTTTCVCLVDGVEVGTCEAALPDLCGVKESCCQEFFNLP
ncbi:MULTISPECIES: hypothetical protein [Sorangium]|uniref:Secreted protein n=1 Tax=Sorangium cellulosum TaxID=56 RepID=A0A4P2R562_SORCE|nr:MULTISPECIES: hypothetical protein [Sorangium]AUX38250.1 uncharacterized protein SOCE836_104910 [Sorangium cellulosum]WCQ97539.1 hypothetical protein NQZ70_10333 [Sorangium sp. Soce836]